MAEKDRTEKGDLKAQYRDIAKVYNNGIYTMSVLGIENQTTVDKSMPVRIMGYDYASYREQADNNRFDSPVITIVLNFSETRWKEPKSLHELFHVPEYLKEYVQNYRIEVFDIAYLEDEVIEQFASDFKVVARFFKMRRIKADNFNPYGDTEINHVEAVLDLLAVFCGDNRYSEIYDNVLRDKIEKGGDVTMCSLVDALEAKGEKRGKLEGLKALVNSLKKFCGNFEELYNEIISNENYADSTREEVLKYY